MSGYLSYNSEKWQLLSRTKGYLHKILRISNQHADDLIGVKSELSRNFLVDDRLNEPGVIGVGIGGGVPGKRSGFLAVRIAATSREALEALPKRIHGIPVVGELASEFHTQRRCRPVHAGVSVGLASVGSLPGTLTGFVTIRGTTYALSAAHVLCPAAAGAQIDVVQPAIADNGSMAADVIGTSLYAQWQSDGIDAHVAKLNSDIEINCRLNFRYHSRRLYGSASLPVIDMPVCKIGKRTWHTNGKVTIIGLDLRVTCHDGSKMVVRNNFLVRGRGGKFSDSGDSGSLVFSKSGRRPVGMIVAGNNAESVCAPMANILSKFGAEFRVK